MSAPTFERAEIIAEQSVRFLEAEFLKPEHGIRFDHDAARDVEETIRHAIEGARR